MSMGMIHGHSPAVAFPCSVTCWFPPLSRVSLWLAASEKSHSSQSVSPVCASVQPPPQSSGVWCDGGTVTLGDLSLPRDNCHHLNPSKGSGLLKRLCPRRGNLDFAFHSLT